MKLPKLSAVLPALKGLWVKEPVLVSTVVPVLVTVGVLSADQASALTNALAGAASIAVELAAAFKVRSVVTSPANAPKEK